jgi:hypothetical protein
MGFKIMLNDICQEMTLSAIEVYEFSRWMAGSFSDDDFNDDGDLVEGVLYE